MMLNNKWIKTALAITILGGGAAAITTQVFAAPQSTSVSPKASVTADPNQKDGETADDLNQVNDKEVPDNQEQATQSTEK